MNIAKPRPFRELLKDYQADPSRWNVIKIETTPSTNIRNKGGASVQELLQQIDTGEQMVRHTLLKPDGSLFQPPHFRPFWR